MKLTHTDLADPGLPKLQCLLDRADHYDVRCPIRQGDGSRGEGPNTHTGAGSSKTTGDGLVVEFSRVVDALRCATEWQCSMAERNVAAPGDNRIKFRIGVHQGDIVVEIAPSLTLLDTPPNTANPIRDYSEHKVDTADPGAGATSRVECH
jgi:class 3 adenylate cyclase